MDFLAHFPSALLTAALIVPLVAALPAEAQDRKPPRRVVPAVPPASDEAKAWARARVQTLTLQSDFLKREMPFNLILPPDYATSGLSYPVLYLLHGSYGTYQDWNNNTGIAAYVADLPLIVVMPDAAGNSRYVNSPGFGRYQDFFLTELVPYIDKTYRTIAKRRGRALAGLSMGGYGAWRIGLDAPKMFVSAASLSGSFNWGEGEFDSEQIKSRAVPLYGGDGPEARQMYAADQLWKHVEKNIGQDGKWQGPALYFDMGTEDGLLSSNRLMKQRLQERGIPFVYAEHPGAHTWPYWDEHIRDALAFHLRHLAAPIRR